MCRRSSVVFLVIGLTVSGAALAAKPVKPPPPPPPACTDAFPSFAYHREATRQVAPAIVLASENACRREVIRESSDLTSQMSLHLTADRKAGVVIWAEEPGDGGRYTVYWRRFSIDGSGTFNLAQPEIIDLTASTDLALQPGELLLNFIGDLWGNADHSRLYLSVRRAHVASDRVTNVSSEWRVYEFIDGSAQWSDFSVLAGDASDRAWACQGIAFPQFVASCYGSLPNGTWDPTGTGLYALDVGGDWQGFFRIDIANGDGAGGLLPLSDWTFGEPTLVFAGRRTPGEAQYYEPAAVGGGRPKAGASEADATAISYIRRSGQQSFRAHAVLDTDLCAQTYSYLAAGNLAGSDTLWLDCLDASFYTSHLERPQAWQTPDALIDRALTKSGSNLYRRHVKGALAGTSVLLVEGAFIAVSGN